jgi:hypothetical protein
LAGNNYIAHGRTKKKSRSGGGLKWAQRESKIKATSLRMSVWFCKRKSGSSKEKSVSRTVSAVRNITKYDVIFWRELKEFDTFPHIITIALPSVILRLTGKMRR